MFEIRLAPSGEVVMAGRLEATQCDAALRFLEGVPVLRVIDLGPLEYIASSGLRVLLLTQKRLKQHGPGLQLVNVRPQIHDIFRFAGFDQIIDMARANG